MKLKLATLAAMAALAATPALAQTLTPEDLIHRHMDFGAKGDLDGLANDFAVDGASINNGAASIGREAIKAQFAKLITPRPGGGNAMGAIKIDKIWSQGNVGFMTWAAGPMHVTEVFVTHDNKIVSQSVFMSGAPGGPPPAAK
ncbi:MAG TPA: nuclear transport factor 2 family protein [Caulobacteraceae bacterium]|jgi:hypothetical protein|nr:nuclear transport factor 2 family protein [Caulobacteraceae bacterium]